MEITRRDLMIGTAGLAARLAAKGSHGGEPPKALPKRPFGKTGFIATIYALGTAEIPSNAEAVPAIKAALDGGVNYIDTAPSYQNTRSETAVGLAIEGRRKDLFIATKTLARDADGAYREVQESLSRLKCNHIDLLQIHAVNDFGTLDRVLAKGGAVEGLARAIRDGLIRHIGITGHTAPEVILKAIDSYRFAGILIPISALDYHVSDFATEVLPRAVKLGIGIAGMKALKGMELATGGKFEPEPLIRYAITHQLSTLTLGLRKAAEIPQNLEIFRAFKPMSKPEMEGLRGAVKEQATTRHLWWKRR
jgi:uncharacterized protein